MRSSGENRNEKKRRWLQMLSVTDGRYVAEADPDASQASSEERKKTSRRVLGAVAACLCAVLIGVNLWLFLPLKNELPDVSQYASSPYYGLIQKLNAYRHENRVRYKNNFEKLISKLSSGTKDAMGAAPEDGAAIDTAGDTDSGALYREVTDNQVEGIIEGDRFKRSDEYLYYLNANETYRSGMIELQIFSIKGENSVKVGSYAFDANGWSDGYNSELYLSQDCQTVTVVLPYYQDGRSCIRILALDVSEPTQIREKRCVLLEGDYVSSRMTDGRLVLMSRVYIATGQIDFSDASTFVPQIDFGNGMECVPAEGIVSPDILTNTSYTVMLMLDEVTLERVDSAALLSFSSELYVSEDYIFAARNYSDRTERDGVITQTAMSELFGLSYAEDCFGLLGSLRVEGFVLNQYSMDERDGVLRVVTTTNTQVYRNVSEDGRSGIEYLTDESNANLYCIQIDEKALLASVIAFAPQNERVKSVRFDGEIAYVCTAIEHSMAGQTVLSDPVYFFDLSDLSNITWKDTGEIEGFSSSLVDFGDGYLLGIGYGRNYDTLKIEVWEETEYAVTSVCDFESANTEFASEYKAYYIDRENRLVGLAIGIRVPSDRTTVNYRYMLLSFDGERLRMRLETELAMSAPSYARAVYIDGWLYMLGADGLTVRRASVS